MRTQLKDFESDPEKMFRQELEKRGIKFEAQAPFRNGFIVDFLLRDEKIIIEVDYHVSHFEPKGKRKQGFRDMMFKKLGYTIFHFTPRDVEKLGVDGCINKVI